MDGIPVNWIPAIMLALLVLVGSLGFSTPSASVHVKNDDNEKRLINQNKDKQTNCLIPTILLAIFVATTVCFVTVLIKFWVP